MELIELKRKVLKAFEDALPDGLQNHYYRNQRISGVDRLSMKAAKKHAIDMYSKEITALDLDPAQLDQSIRDRFTKWKNMQENVHKNQPAPIGSTRHIPRQNRGNRKRRDRNTNDKSVGNGSSTKGLSSSDEESKRKEAEEEGEKEEDEGSQTTAFLSEVAKQFLASHRRDEDDSTNSSSESHSFLDSPPELDSLSLISSALPSESESIDDLFQIDIVEQRDEANGADDTGCTWGLWWNTDDGIVMEESC